MDEQKLLPHQNNLVNMIQTREEKLNIQFDSKTKMLSSVGILGEPHGYGRMHALIKVIEEDKMKWDISQSYTKKISYSYMGYNRTQITRTLDYTKLNCTLLLCGLSVMYQWEYALKFSSLKWRSILNQKTASRVDPNNYNIILCSPNMYNHFIKRFEYKFTFKRFIILNPLYINIRDMKDVMAGFYWFVSAYPIFLLKTYKTSSQFLNRFFPSYLHETLMILIVKNENSFLPSLSKVTNKNYICFNPSQYSLHQLRSVTMINYIKERQIEKVIDELKCNVTTNFIQHIMKKLEMEKKICNAQDIKDSITGLIRKLTTRFKDGKIEQKTCSICYEDYKKPMMVTCCYNIYCSHCLLWWLSTKRNCPLCRTYLNLSMLLYRTDNKENIPKTIKIIKKEYMVKILKKYKNKKCIIFISIKSLLSTVSDFLTYHKIPYVLLQGSKSKREKNIKSYRKGPVNVIILMDVYNFIGLNLKETRHIINYIGMHNESACCALSCVQNIENKSPTTIHHLI